MTIRLLVLFLALPLAGCFDGPPVAVPRAPLDLTLTRRCDDPVPKPDRDLSEHEVADLWGSDRLALRDCGRRFAATVAITERRDAALAGR